MNFRLSEEEERLRSEICRFLQEEMGTTHDSDPTPMLPGYMPDREFERKLGSKGWLALSWPIEFGGGGRPVTDQFIADEEVALHGGPASDALGRVIVGPALIAAGSEAQKRAYLPGMARGELTFCLGYTEPEAGSDFAALQTRAVRDGDDYVINGRKIFTSGAESSEYCWLAARTSSDNAKHAGISVFVVPMDSPGVEVRPLDQPNGQTLVQRDSVRGRSRTRERACGSRERGLARPHLGARFGANHSLPSVHPPARARGLTRYSQGLRNGARQVGTIRIVRQAIAQLSDRVRGCRPAASASDRHGLRGVDYRAQAAMVKLFNTEFAQRLYNAGVQILGLHGQLREGDPHAPISGSIAHEYLSTVQDTIGAGTSEVQREIDRDPQARLTPGMIRRLP